MKSSKQKLDKKRCYACGAKCNGLFCVKVKAIEIPAEPFCCECYNVTLGMNKRELNKYIKENKSL